MQHPEGQRQGIDPGANGRTSELQTRSMQLGQTLGEAPQARKRRHGLRGSFASRMLLATLHRDQAEQPTSHPATPGRTCAGKIHRGWARQANQPKRDISIGKSELNTMEAQTRRQNPERISAPSERQKLRIHKESSTENALQGERTHRRDLCLCTFVSVVKGFSR